MGWIVLGLFIRGGFGEGGADPRSSPEKCGNFLSNNW